MTAIGAARQRRLQAPRYAGKAHRCTGGGGIGSQYALLIQSAAIPTGLAMPIPAILDGHLTLPVIGSPMFIVSTPELVMAPCKAGILGSFPALNAPPQEKN